MSLWVVDIQPAKRLALSGEPIVEFIRQTGHEVIETVYDPENNRFPDNLQPLFESGRPLILRGSVGFAHWVHSNWSVSPGAFPSDSLRTSVWLPAYGEMALNHGAMIVTYAEFNAHRATYENLLGGTLFLKPADGGKLLSGTVLEPGRSLFDAHYAAHRRWNPIPDDFRLLLSRNYPISREWRFIIAGDKVIARSQYKIGQMLEVSSKVPEGAEELAQKIATHPWRPTDVFVADIAETENGYRLLELNTFGTSGLYACDLEVIVKAVSACAA